MTDRQLPRDFFPRSAVALKYKVPVKSQLIYTTLLAVVFSTLAALPLIKVTISVNGAGSLQSSIARSTLNVPVSGRLTTIRIHDNQKVRQGDTLLVIDGNLPGQQIALVNDREKVLKDFIGDISLLLTILSREPSLSKLSRLKTNQYMVSGQQYFQELRNAGLVKEQAVRVFARNEELFKNKVLTLAEYEKFRFDYEQAVSAFQMVSIRYKNQWLTELNQFKTEAVNLKSRELDFSDQKKHFTLISPVTGSIQNLGGLQKNAYVFANQKIADISPDTDLVATCYIRTTDIGLIHTGQSVRFQIDAFNYNQWGLADGRVTDVSDDVTLLDNAQPVFVVKCVINRPFLQLKTGYKGFLKKGMGFTARFVVTRRSLYQLLYDKVDNWINPNIK